jgi:hypothetical protein
MTETPRLERLGLERLGLERLGLERLVVVERLAPIISRQLFLT